MYGGKIRFNKSLSIFCSFPYCSVQNPFIQYTKVKVRHIKKNCRLKPSTFSNFEIRLRKATLGGCLKLGKY